MPLTDFSGTLHLHLHSSSHSRTDIESSWLQGNCAEDHSFCHQYFHHVLLRATLLNIASQIGAARLRVFTYVIVII